MKPVYWILIIISIFVLAGFVVYLVLMKADKTLKQAQDTAKQAGDVTQDVKDIGMGAKKAWDDIKVLFGQ